MPDRVVVVDYGASNLQSVIKALQWVSAGKVQILPSSDAAEIRSADRIIFPGQGAMGQCMQHLARRELLQVLRETARCKPFFGICLGLQSLMEHSDENEGVRGLGLFPGRARGLANLAQNDRHRCKIPHMGWNRVWQSSSHPLWEGVEDGAYFYFAHSYYVQPTEPAHIAAHTHYIRDHASVLAQGTLFAVQFHPEKSQRNGLRLLTNFLHWRPVCPTG